MHCDRKVLLVGWDAADWKIINRLIDRGLMPATQKLVEGGVMASLLTLSPVLSPMLWTSIATGKRPYKHGIHGFAEPTPNGRGIRPVTNLSRKTKAIWNILSQQNKRCNVVGWWPSSPAEPINGVMVSNHYQRAPNPNDRTWPIRPGTVHPESLGSTLADLRVHPQDIVAENIYPFVPKAANIDLNKDRRLEGLIRIIADCSSIQSAATWLMQERSWDFMAVYFDAIDHFCHGFMNFHPPQLPWIDDDDFDLYQNVVTAGYVFHDMMLARLMELAGEDATVVLISDHGFHSDHLRRQTVPNEPAGPAAEHREHGIFAISGPGIKRDKMVSGVSLLDITPTLLTLFGLPVGEDMDGRSINEVFQDEPHVSSIPGWDAIEGDAGMHPVGTNLDAHEMEAGIEQLVALGYIDQPNSDKSQAVIETQRELDYNLARSYMDGGQHGMAVPLLAKLYQAFPLEFRFGIQLAICLQSLQLIDELSDLIENLKACFKATNLAARKRLAEINEIAKQRKASIQSNDDSDEKSKAVSGSQLLFSSLEREKIKRLRKLASATPYTLNYINGWVAMAKEEYDEAIRLFRLAGTANSDSTGLHYHLAEAFRGMKKYAEATAEFDIVLRLDPHNPGAHLGLARIALAQGETGQAMQMAQTALGLRYDMPVAHYVTGVGYTRLGEYAKAIQSLIKALELNPNFHEAHSQLAIVYGECAFDAQKAESHSRQAEQICLNQNKQATLRILTAMPKPGKIDFASLMPEISLVSPGNEQSKDRPCVKSLSQCVGGTRTSAIDKVAQTVSERTNISEDTIFIVSGLPRSGTSMMMQMLQLGGIEPLTDHLRVPDKSNPRGYYEFDKAKLLAKKNDWLNDARRKALKVISPLIGFLPEDQDYRVIVMDRPLDEIVASQSSMLARMKQESPDISTASLIRFLATQYETAIHILKQLQIPHLVVSYHHAIGAPDATATKVADFIGRPTKSEAMGKAVDTGLYRERTGEAA